MKDLIKQRAERIKELTQVELMNLLADFINEFHLEGDCIIDVIEEFASKYDVDELYLSTELSDYKPFLDIVENNLKKYKYVKEFKDKSNEWE